MSGTAFRLVPPDGGWGFVIVVAISMTNMSTFMPLVTFGIIFGRFMESIGDEAGGTALVIGVYLSVQWGSGLVANIVLQRMSNRKVGVIGAVLNFIGLLGASFATDIYQLLLSFSVIQALGYGLMLPAMLTSFNLYFDKRKTVAYNFSNVVVILVSVTFPALASFLTQNFGFRGANMIQAAITLNCLPMMLCLHPVKWHSKKQTLSPNETKTQELIELNQLIGEKEETIEEGTKFLSTGENSLKEPKVVDYQDVVSDSSVCSQVWKSVVKSLDLKLFTDPIYVNVIIGASLCLSADYTFLSAFPLILTGFRVNQNDATLIMTIFYAADIFGRLGLFALVAFTEVRNRNLLLMGAILAVCFRTAFVLNHSFWWLAVCSACMGSLRCLFQTTYPLIFAELYPKRFVTAFSLFMITCGIVSLLVGLLIGVVKDATSSDVIVLHFLTVLNLLCAIPWLLEYVYRRATRHRRVQEH